MQLRDRYIKPGDRASVAALGFCLLSSSIRLVSIVMPYNDRIPHHPLPYDGQHGGVNAKQKKNRVVDTYKNMFIFGLARWAFSIPVLALCAMQFGDSSTLTYPPYVASLIYNIACVSTRFGPTT